MNGWRTRRGAWDIVSQPLLKKRHSVGDGRERTSWRASLCNNPGACHDPGRCGGTRRAAGRRHDHRALGERSIGNREAERRMTSTASFCEKCGNLLGPNSQFCDKCGTPVAPAPAGASGRPPQSVAGAALPPPPPPALAYGAPPSMQPPPGYGQPLPVGQTTNGLAIASLVLGIVWVFGLGSILAVIFGFVGRKQIRQSRGRQGGGGMAVAGIVLGFVGVVGLILWIVLIVAVTTSINNCVDQIADRRELVDVCHEQRHRKQRRPVQHRLDRQHRRSAAHCRRAAGADRREQRDQPGNQRFPAALGVGPGHRFRGTPSLRRTLQEPWPDARTPALRTQARHAAGTMVQRGCWSAVSGREGVTLFS